MAVVVIRSGRDCWQTEQLEVQGLQPHQNKHKGIEMDVKSLLLFIYYFYFYLILPLTNKWIPCVSRVGVNLASSIKCHLFTCYLILEGKCFIN